MVARQVVASLRGVVVGVALVVGLVLGLRAGVAQADRGPEKALGGKVLISDKKFPTYGKSVAAYVAALRKQSKTQLMEDKTGTKWQVHVAAFFKRPLDDIEIVVKLYDVGNRIATPLATFEQFLDQRGQTALLSQFTLERKNVGVNKQLMMTIEVKGRVVASGKFKIIGEPERFTGKADFSDEDTEGNDDQ